MPKPGSTFCARVRNENAHGPVTRAIMEIHRKQRTWRCHKSHLVWECTGKMREPYSGDGILYGNLQEKNAHGHVTRAILCGHLQEKCRTPR